MCVYVCVYQVRLGHSEVFLHDVLQASLEKQVCLCDSDGSLFLSLSLSLSLCVCDSEGLSRAEILCKCEHELHPVLRILEWFWSACT